MHSFQPNRQDVTVDFDPAVIWAIALLIRAIERLVIAVKKPAPRKRK